MKDIPRYRPVANDRYGITDDIDGKLCEYRDYARLKAEVERLRKAGDEMLGDYRETGVIFPPSEAAWNAAKEGKPSV